MRYVIALIVMFVWGGLQFASAQDQKDCTPASSTEGKTDMSDDASVQGNEDEGQPADDDLKVSTEGDTSADMESNEGVQCPTSMSTSETTVSTTEVEKEHSTGGKIIRAPLKFIGNIPKAGVSLVSETLEGTAHIVGAPFKAIGKLFGRDEDDSNNRRKKRLEAEAAVDTDVIEEIDENI